MTDLLVSAFTTKKKDLSLYYSEKIEFAQPEQPARVGSVRKKYSYEEIKRAVLERRIRVSPQYALNKIRIAPSALTHQQRERAERNKTIALKRLQNNRNHRMLC